MEKGIRKNKRFIITELFITSLIIIMLILLFYYIKKNNDVIDKYENYKSELNSKNEEYEALKISLQDLENKDLLTRDINDEINRVKTDYFNKLKEFENKVLNNETNKKIAYLTFDDGPYYNTYKVLDILDRYGVKATFFTSTVNGQYCYDNKSYNCFLLYEEYAKRGHTIANHTYTHAIRKGLYASTASFMEALKKQENHIKNLSGGYVTNIVRFPGGSGSSGKLKQSIIAELRKNNYGWVDWTAGDGDGGKLTSTEQALRNFKSTINEKIEVVLFHDYSKYTTALLPQMIEYLESNNYVILPLFYESVKINK